MNEPLTAILEAVKILSPTSFLFSNGPSIETDSFDCQWWAQLPATFPVNPLLRALLRTIYDHGYARQYHGVGPTLPPTFVAQPDPEFAARLSLANRTQNRWDPGWRVDQLSPNGQIYVHKENRYRAANPGEYATAFDGLGVSTGNSVCLRVVRESLDRQPGFYFAFGDTLANQFEDWSTIRLYFHCTAEGAPRVLETLTTELNSRQVPFRIKCLSHPASYDRADAAVLYIARSHFSLAAALLAGLPTWLTSELRPAVPLFTKKLRDGIGVAEDPSNGESFGQNRCRLVAEGIVDAWMQGLQSPEARLCAVRARFSMTGLNLDYPHLNPGSVDVFELPANTATIA